MDQANSGHNIEKSEHMDRWHPVSAIFATEVNFKFVWSNPAITGHVHSLANELTTN